MSKTLHIVAAILSVSAAAADSLTPIDTLDHTALMTLKSVFADRRVDERFAEAHRKGGVLMRIEPISRRGGMKASLVFHFVPFQSPWNPPNPNSWRGKFAVRLDMPQDGDFYAPAEVEQLRGE